MSCYEPCPACNRHVVSDETTCPFCAAPLPDFCRKVERAPLRGRRSRAGLLAAGAGAALITVGSCSSAYGLPPVVDSGSMSDGAAGAGGAPAAEYGAPPAFAEPETKPTK